MENNKQDRAEKIILYIEQLRSHYEKHQTVSNGIKERYNILTDLLEQIRMIE